MPFTKNFVPKLDITSKILISSVARSSYSIETVKTEIIARRARIREIYTLGILQGMDGCNWARGHPQVVLGD